MKKTILSALAAGMCSLLGAQTNITPEVLKQLEGSYTGTPTEKALRNAISNVGLQKMAVNQELPALSLAPGHHFLHVLLQDHPPVVCNLIIF